MKLKTLLALFGLSLLFSSCATMTHSASQNVFVTSKTDSTMICVNYDTSQTYYLPATLKIDRSYRDVTLIAIKDTIQRKVMLENYIPGRFWLGNMGMPIMGHFLDKLLAKEKLYSVPKNITIDLNDTTLNYPYSKLNKYCDFEKGLVRFSYGIPIGNYIYLPKGNYHVSRVGFKGYNIGVDYFYLNNRIISVGMGRNGTAISPFGKYDLSSVYSTKYYMVSYGFSTSNSVYQLGIQFSKLKKFDDYFLLGILAESLGADYFVISQAKSYGLHFSANFRIGNETFFGFIYQPNFLHTYNGTAQFGYGNTISMNITYTPEIYRPTKQKLIKNGNNKYTY